MLTMTEEQHLAYKAAKCSLYLRRSITPDNDYEAWRLIHTLRSKGFQAAWNESSGVVETDASKTTLRKYYNLIKD